jgi:demethylmenaquinone methyltransferase/2-methoxy-6-polyprenyl-1,4-benzoquinol methylase
MHGPSNPTALARAERFLRLAPGASLPPVRDGVLDLLDRSFTPTFTQRTLDTRATAWFYDRVRNALAPRIGMPTFEQEVETVTRELALAPGDVVLDVACGQGNFTVELARAVGPTGLVIGLDIAGSMLARAANRVRRAGLDNVVLIRGDALDLPFADAAFAKLNCSGGLHQMPDLDRALAEFARVTRPGARFTGSSFAESGVVETGWRGALWRRWKLHFVPIQALGRTIERAGFADVDVRMAGSWIGYASAQRRAA